MKKILCIISCIVLIATAATTTSCRKNAGCDEGGAIAGNYIIRQTTGQQYELNSTGTLEQVDGKNKIVFTGKEDPNIYVAFICNKFDSFSASNGMTTSYSTDFDGASLGVDRSYQVILHIPQNSKYITYNINNLDGTAKRPTVTTTADYTGAPETTPTMSNGTSFFRYKDSAFNMSAVYVFASTGFNVNISGSVVK